MPNSRDAEYPASLPSPLSPVSVLFHVYFCRGLLSRLRLPGNILYFLVSCSDSNPTAFSPDRAQRSDSDSICRAVPLVLSYKWSISTSFAQSLFASPPPPPPRSLPFNCCVFFFCPDLANGPRGLTDRGLVTSWGNCSVTAPGT